MRSAVVLVACVSLYHCASSQGAAPEQVASASVRPYFERIHQIAATSDGTVVMGEMGGGFRLAYMDSPECAQPLPNPEGVEPPVRLAAAASTPTIWLKGKSSIAAYDGKSWHTQPLPFGGDIETYAVSDRILLRTVRRCTNDEIAAVNGDRALLKKVYTEHVAGFTSGTILRGRGVELRRELDVKDPDGDRRRIVERMEAHATDLRKHPERYNALAEKTREEIQRRESEARQWFDAIGGEQRKSGPRKPEMNEANDIGTSDLKRRIDDLSEAHLMPLTKARVGDVVGPMFWESDDRTWIAATIVIVDEIVPSSVTPFEAAQDRLRKSLTHAQCIDLAALSSDGGNSAMTTLIHLADLRSASLEKTALDAGDGILLTGVRAALYSKGAWYGPEHPLVARFRSGDLSGAMFSLDDRLIVRTRVGAVVAVDIGSGEIVERFDRFKRTSVRAAARVGEIFYFVDHGESLWRFDPKSGESIELLHKFVNYLPMDVRGVLAVGPTGVSVLDDERLQHFPLEQPVHARLACGETSQPLLPLLTPGAIPGCIKMGRLAIPVGRLTPYMFDNDHYNPGPRASLHFFDKKGRRTGSQATDYDVYLAGGVGGFDSANDMVSVTSGKDVQVARKKGALVVVKESERNTLARLGSRGRVLDSNPLSAAGMCLDMLLGPDGDIYVLCNERKPKLRMVGRLLRLSNDGQEVWRAEAPGIEYAMTILTPDGRIAVVAMPRGDG